MSNLISNRQATNRVSQTHPPIGSVAATSPPDVGMTGVPPVTPFGPMVCTAFAAWRTHQRPQSSKEVKQSGEASSVHREGSQTGNASFS
ncbi:hypothetical protein D8674_004131 [Pyrus ussuriensis x Pyrus communis]|uniref:Uncharacterized protein n=1 Tax=Pyrus ussuriensis x Pyrus communis TaxID=2448454 RepID=A0A5N5FJ09_9ROSA|nr:hypothetical protein D8674_004131 [Pyrus ussuriensis x Pyrus communis]